MPHTRGPWELAKWKKEISIEKDSGSFHGLLCHVDLDDYSPETGMANAKLIAAAPEMLIALKAALNALTNQRYLVPRIGMEAEHKLVSDAIAKAEKDA